MLDYSLKNKMIYTHKIKNAIGFALQVHEIDRKQKRKGKDIPYIVHPLGVGLILARAGADEDVIVAGILHDTIEDSITAKKVTRHMLADIFGDNVADMVASVSESPKTLSWDDRKREAIEHIQTYSHSSLLVKSADLLNNTSEIVEDYARYGEPMFARFNESKEKVLLHYIDAIHAVLARWPENPLAGDLLDIAIELNGIHANGEE